MNNKKLFSIFSFLVIVLLTLGALSCGRSEIYHNAYDYGYERGASNARFIARDDPDDLRYANPEDFGGANEQYQAIEARLPFDGEKKREYREGYVKGYIEGFNSVKRDKGYSSSSSSKSNSSSSNSRSSHGGGLGFWGWCLLAIGGGVIYIIVPFFFGTKDVEKLPDDDSESESTPHLNNIDIQLSNETGSVTPVQKPETTTIIRPRGCMIADIIGFFALIMVGGAYNCTSHTWTCYYMYLISIIGALVMVMYIKEWRKYMGKRPASTLALIFGWLFVAFYGVMIVVNLISLIAS